MKGKILYIFSIIIIALPWLFLLEAVPIPYNRINTLIEVLIEGAMFAALIVIATLLKKELKRLKVTGIENGLAIRAAVRILFVLASVTLFVVGLILLLIGISYSL